MTERLKKFGEELAALVKLGDRLQHAMNYECSPDIFREGVVKAFKGDEEKAEKFLESLPRFGDEYQSWYSKAQALIKQVLPDRLQDFISYFEPPKGRKDITYQNYMIRDYLQGLTITRGWEKVVVVDGRAAIPEFVQQLNMVKAAQDALASTLIDLKAVLQADLFDSELETAEALAKSGYLRAAGAMCGVVLEKHLLHICDNHNIRISKKNPGISDLIQPLKDADVITVAQ